mgnify:CR=1 FL=1
MGFWDDKKPPKEDFATKEDIKKLERDIQKLLKDKDQPDTAGAGSKLVKGMAKGFGNIARSLSTSENKKRMRIAQMPGGKAPIATYNTCNPISGKSAGIKRHHISNAPKRED